MKSQVAFVKQETNWFALIPRLILIVVLCFIFYQFNKVDFLIIAFVVYFLISFTLRQLFFPSVLKKGINLIKQEKFKDAIPFIQETVDYYTNNNWIDRFRFFLMISSSKNTIRESSICNLAYCYLQIGEVKKAEEMYQNVLSQYPENINAKNMLNMIGVLSKK